MAKFSATGPIAHFFKKRRGCYGGIKRYVFVRYEIFKAVKKLGADSHALKILVNVKAV